MINLKVKKNPMPEQDRKILEIIILKKSQRDILHRWLSTKRCAVSTVGKSHVHMAVRSNGPDPGIHCKDYRGRL